MSPIIGLAGIGFSLYFVFSSPLEGFRGFYDLPSLVMLALCPPSIMLLSHTIGDFLTGIGALIKAQFGGQKRTQVEVINILTHASALVRAEGIGALLRIRDKIRYELLRDGISLIVNDFTSDEIRHNLTAKINAKQTRMQLAANLFENMAKVSPGIGMIGTLLGLVEMMANLNDPTTIGGGMALAMITTLYGLLLGTIIYGPCSEKIGLEADKNMEIDMMVLEGVLTLKGKKSSIHLKDIMKTYANKNVPAGGGDSNNRPQQYRRSA